MLILWMVFILLTLNARLASSQSYPIQVTTSLLAPYSPELSYYTSADANNLQVFINLLDLETIDLRTKLRVTIEGAGVTLTTSPSYVPPALILQGGVPTMLSGFDLRNYLNPDHMEFEGITRAEFIRTGQFPEGFYTFTIEVLDYNRSVQISNSSMATAWIVLNDPPLINFPFNGDKLITNDPQIVNFSWVGRHLASPNSAFSTEYEFTLYEMYPGQTDPEVAVRSSNSIFSTTTSQSSLFYGPADPLLIPGKQYAYRVQAYDISGRDLFKNEGYSETYSFQYGDACQGLTAVSGASIGQDRLKITWESDFSHTSFEVHYRQSGKTSWMTETTFTTSQILPDLQPNTKYEYKVLGKCQQYYGEESTIRTLTTEVQAITEEEQEEYSCGTTSQLDDLSPTPLDRALRIFDEFHIGGVDVIVLEVLANADGSYTGSGYTPLPMFKGAGVKVKIQNVVINEDFYAIAGRVVTVYDPDGGFIVGDREDTEEVDTTNDQSGNTEEIEIVSVGEEIQSVTVNEDNVIVILDSEGNEISLPEDANGDPITLPEDGEVLVIEDSSGNAWTIDSEGNVSEGSPSSLSGGSGSSTDTEDSQGIGFGPLVVEFTEEPEIPSTTDDQGFYSYENLTVQVSLKMEDSDYDPIEVEIPDATISYKKHSEDESLKDITLTYTNDAGLSIGSIGFISGSLKNVELAVDGEGNLSGSISMTAELNEDKTFKDIFVIKSGINGDISYTFSGGDDFSGELDLSEVENVKVELRNGNNLIASMDNGAFNNGGFFGDFSLASGAVAFETTHFKSELKSLNISASYDKTEGFKFLSGSSEVKFSEMKGVTGTVNVNLSYLNDEITTTISSNQLSGFGMQFSDILLSANVNKSFDLTELQGTLKAKHNDFDASLQVSDFKYTSEGLQVFKASGDVSYDAVSFKIQDAEYVTSGDEMAIVFDAFAEYDSEGTESVVQVTGFKVDQDGEISYDAINASAQSDIVLGPIAVKWSGEYEETAGDKIDGNKTREISGTAEAILKTIDPKTNEEVFKSIGEIQVIYRKYKNSSNGGLISASLTYSGSTDFSSINGIDLTMESMNLSLNEDEELSGNISFDASLTEDKTIKEIFTLKKGLSGSISYGYNGTSSFAGTFDFSGLENINLVVNKGGDEIAALENGSFTGSVLSGTIRSKANASFTTNSFQIAVNELSLNSSYDLSSNDFSISSGSGQLTVGNMTGIDGSIIVGLEYGIDDNFNASVESSSSISGFGLTFSDLMLNAELSSSFELTTISGSLKAKHDDINTNLNVSDFEIKNGSLTKIEASGAIQYQGFDFNLEKCTYENNQITLDAKLAINATGTESQFEVEDFMINNQGAISLRRVKGSLNKSNQVNVSFDIAMAENRFTGTFDGSLQSIGVGISGTLDIGKEETYNYAYLKLNAQTDLVLGTTGLKITSMGGQVGYNYRLNYNNGAFTGQPSNGNYLLGLSLGLADVSNMCEIVGTSVIQFSQSTFALSLQGTVNITRNNPIISSELGVQYELPANTIEGHLSTSLQVPQNSGKYFNAQSSVDFSFANNNWSVNSTQLSGDFLSVMRFDGSFRFDGQISPFTANNMYLQGSASMDFEKSYSASLGSVAGVSVSCRANINSQVTVQLNEQGLSGELSVRAIGELNLALNAFGYETDNMQATLDAAASIKTLNSKLYIEGSQSVNIMGDKGGTFSVDFDYVHDL